MGLPAPLDRSPVCLLPPIPGERDVMSRFRLSSGLARWTSVGCFFWVTPWVIAGETLPPINQRYQDEAVSETPHFQKHVVPLLGRLGCNGRACHGSFQGRGGFQLSLFGYDFAGDHQALTDADSGRVDLADIGESLIIAKPIDADAHEGGQRFEPGSWQHHVLSRWIESGAGDDRSTDLALQRLEITPAEILFATDNAAVELTATAHWSDGSVEDVTPLCRFRTNDDAVADVSENGTVTSGDKGDTHIVVFYDNAVTCVPVIRPLSDATVTPDSAHPIDQHIANRLDQLGIEPSGLCSDADFVRRVSLDITGLLPEPARVQSFLASTEPNKRESLIDELLATEHHAAWWATKFCDWTGNNEDKLRNALPVRGVAPALWHRWLQTRLHTNVPYDEIVAGIVNANSREPGESYREYCESMSQACREGGADGFAERSSMPLYWARREFQKPEERAIGLAYAFLGIRIECAQCHKHPFDRWSKDDFDQFAKLFTPIRTNGNLVAKDAKKTREEMLAKLELDSGLKGNRLRRALGEQMLSGATVPFGELAIQTRQISERDRRRRAKLAQMGRKVAPIKVATGKILGGETVTLDADPRERLVDWMREETNPYFAPALVNRVWEGYFGVGLVDPTDDLNLANPPSNAPLLDYLSDQLIAHDFDLRWLHKEITTSHAYQRSTEVHSTNRHDRKHFSHHVPHRLPAEVISDAIRLATLSDLAGGEARENLWELSISDFNNRSRRDRFALDVFGSSKRESNCDCDRSDAPSLLQAVYVRNDIDMHRQLNANNGWVADACRQLGLDTPISPQLIDDATHKRIEAQKKQVHRLVERYKKMPPAQQERAQKSIRSALAKLRGKAKRLGVKVPSLDRLVADPDAWNSESPVSDTDHPNGVASIDSDRLGRLVDDAYLRTLSRWPSDEERSIATDFVQSDGDPSQNVASLMWALLNTKEFVLSH